MRNRQCVPPGRQKEEFIDALAIGFGCLDCALGVVPDFDTRVGHDRTARIGYDAHQSARSRRLSIQFVRQTGSEQKDWKEKNHAPQFHRSTHPRFRSKQSSGPASYSTLTILLKHDFPIARNAECDCNAVGILGMSALQTFSEFD